MYWGREKKPLIIKASHRKWKRQTLICSSGKSDAKGIYHNCSCPSGKEKDYGGLFKSHARCNCILMLFETRGDSRIHPFSTVDRFGYWYYCRGRDKENGPHTTQPQWWMFTKDKDLAVKTAKSHIEKGWQITGMDYPWFVHISLSGMQPAPPGAWVILISQDNHGCVKRRDMLIPPFLIISNANHQLSASSLSADS